MPKPDKVYKVFISYSWSSSEHELWVTNLAERLMSDGVLVTFDKWDLKEGQDKNIFMESMVTSSEIDKVLIILDQVYSKKADDRTGGVGTETQIISPEIYSNISQEKFIPIIAEKNENNEPFLPTFLKSRIYIDLSEIEHYENGYEQLLRNIYKRPSHQKPQLGSAPTFLFEDSKIKGNTSLLLRSFEKKVEKNPSRINALVRDLLDEFYSGLTQLEIKFSSKDDLTIGKEIIDNLNSFKPLRDDYIHFLEYLSKENIDSYFDYDILVHFFEKLPRLTFPPIDRSSWSDFEYDNFRFIISELFLYTIAVPIKYENYKLVEEILHAGYFIKDRRNYNKEFKSYESFYYYVDSFDAFYNQTYSKNYISPMADLLIKRAPNEFEKEELAEADLLCYYVGNLNKIHWFPKTYIYRDEYTSFDFFNRLVSTKHFEKVKGILGVDSPDKLKNKILEIENDKEHQFERRGYRNAHQVIKNLNSIIDPEKIATIR